ncbi:MAG TPA: hypothetical protein VII56_03405 [Rhizomicrobium sp.]
MASALDRLFVLPFSDARLREAIDTHLRFRSVDAIRATLSENNSHITQKSGALLAAQAIFIVVDTYGIDHGWPRLAVVVSVLALILSALIVMINLRTVYMEAPPNVSDAAELERASLFQIGKLAASRGASFNTALYLTFLSVILMGFGAIDAAMGWA